MQKITVGIIYGGRSVEHEVSIISALQALHGLDKEKYNPLPVYISKQGVWYTGDALWQVDNYQNMDKLLADCKQVVFSPNYNDLKLLCIGSSGLFKKQEEIKIDVAFPVIHGSHGEDGCLQGLLELSGIPFVGPSVLGSACGMDKIAMKAILKENNIPTPDYTWFYYLQWEENQEPLIAQIESKLTYPVIVKPANLGSSIGIKKASNREQLLEAVELAGNFSPRILVEKVIEPLREINCSVLGSPDEMETSFCEEPASADEILSFRDKYLNSGNKGMSGATRRIPADLSAQTQATIEDYSRRAFVSLDLHGVCRIDFLLKADTNEVYLNEVNTIPGSLSFYLWEPAGKSFGKLLDDLIRLALKRSRNKEKTIYSYSSNILSQGGFKGGKK